MSSVYSLRSVIRLTVHVPLDGRHDPYATRWSPLAFGEGRSVAERALVVVELSLLAACVMAALPWLS